MNTFIIVGVLVILLVVIAGAMYFILNSFSSGNVAKENLAMQGMLSHQRGDAGDTGFGTGVSDRKFEEIKASSGRSVAGGAKKKVPLETKKFRAGFYTEQDFAALRVRLLLYKIAPIIIFPFLAQILGNAMGFPATMILVAMVVAGVLGFFMGQKMPESVLDDMTEKRYSEAISALPLVVEALTIGISSGLDLGPCISYVVNMATERRSHNVVTELFVHVEKLVQAGYSLSEALTEVADAFGQKEVAHVFMFLAQCAKQGGEVSKQLQDLSESVSLQKQIQVEGIITKLPVRATGPLTMVFAGFFIMLMGSVFITLANNLKQ